MTKTAPLPEPPPPMQGGSYIWDEATGERRRVVLEPAPVAELPAVEPIAPEAATPAEPAPKGTRK